MGNPFDPNIIVYSKQSEKTIQVGGRIRFVKTKSSETLFFLPIGSGRDVQMVLESPGHCNSVAVSDF